jgi:hypothetical protein
MSRKSRNIKLQEYIVINKLGEAYIGMTYGKPTYSGDWEQAKSLELSSTMYLMRDKGNELLEL